MESISSIIKIPERKKRTSERSELIKFFVDNLRDKNNKPFPARRIAVALSHLKDMVDLYYFKSVCKDILNRKGQVAFQKYFWWSIKVDKQIQKFNINK